MSNKKIKREHPDINSAMLLAVRQGRCDTVSSLISTHGLSHCAAWADGLVLLCDAIEQHHSDVARLLIKSGARINGENSVNTPLHSAAKNQDIKIVRLLLKKGADVNAPDANGKTPVHSALESNHKGIINLMFKRDVNRNAIDNYGSSLLHIAVRENNKKIVDRLLSIDDNNCEMNAPNTELHVACKSGVIADANAKGQDGMTALHIACKNNHAGIVRALLESQADVNAQQHDGTTALHLACRFGHAGIVRALLESQADVNAQQHNGTTALHCACKQGQTYIVRTLLESQADVNAQQHNGTTALHFACEQGHTYIVRALLESQADVNAQQHNGTTALHFACEQGHTYVVRALLESQADVNAQQHNGTTALHLACERGETYIVRALLESHADVHAKKYGITALHIACKNSKVVTCGGSRDNRGQANTVRALLESGAEFEVEEITSYTHEAAAESSLRFAVLLEYCVDLNDTPGLIQLARTKPAKRALCRHVWKLHAAQMFVPCEYRRLISCDVDSEYQSSCKEEVMKMMSETIEKTNISFLDFLAKSKSAAVKVIGNADAMRELNTGYYLRKYPLYAGIIMKQIRSGVERNKHLDKGFQILLGLFPVLPWICTEIIISCLTNKELKMLAEN